MPRAAGIAISSPAGNGTLVHTAIAIAIDPEPGPPVGSDGHETPASRSLVGSQ